MNNNNPYEYHTDGKLGVKIRFLISDRNKDADSLCLITYRALKWRMDSPTSSENQLRSGSWSYDSLVEYNSISQEWRDMLVVKFGNPPEKIKESYFSQHYFTDGKAFDFYELHRYGVGFPFLVRFKIRQFFILYQNFNFC